MKENINDIVNKILGYIDCYVEMGLDKQELYHLVMSKLHKNLLND